MIELRFLPLSFQTTAEDAILALPFPYIPRFVKPFPVFSGKIISGYQIKPFPEYVSLTRQQFIPLQNEMQQYKQRAFQQLQSFKP